MRILTLRSRLFGNAAIYLGANFLNAGVPFLLLPILTRVLTPADYGTIAMFALVVTIFSAFTGLSVHGAITVRYFQLNRSELSEYVGACIAILVSSTAMTVLLVVFIGTGLSSISGVPTDWLLVAVIVSGLQFIANIRLAIWQVEGKAKSYGGFQISQSLVNAVISLFLILIVGMAWEGRTIGQSLAIALFGMVSVLFLIKDGLFKISSERVVHYSKDALKFGVPLIPHVIGGLLIVAADRFVIVRLLDVAHAGIYMVALQIGQALGLLTESFNKAYAPWLMHRLSKPTAEFRVHIVRFTYIYFIVILAIATFLGFVAPYILKNLVGEDFIEASDLVIYLAIGFAFGGCYYMVTNYIFYESRTSWISAVTFFSGAVNILLMYLLIGKNGLAGAGQAFMVTQALSFIGTWWLAHKCHPMPWLRALRPITS